MTTLPANPERLQHAGCWPPQPIPGLPKEPTAGDVLRLSRPDRNALIAVHLFGWHRNEEGSRTYWTNPDGETVGSIPPAFDTDLSADRRVFDHVRSQWPPADQQAFTLELYTIWFARQGKVGGCDAVMAWRVGDFALAVLVVLARKGVVKP